MSTERPRKFSLGDIIRRLNEASGAQQAAASAEAAAAAPPDEAAGRQPRPHAPGLTPGAPALRVPPPPAPPHTQPPATARDADGGEEEFDIFRYLAVLMRRRAAILAVTIAAALYSLFTYLAAERYYVAEARLIFQPGYQQIVGDSRNSWGHWYDRENQFYTHLELLKSRAVLARLAENLQNRVSPAAIAGGLMLKRGQTNGEPNDIIELSFQHPEADMARDVVNELCHSYIEYRREVNGQEQTRLIFKLESQIAKLQEELTHKEDEFRIFREQNRMVQISDETNIVVSQVSNSEVALRQTDMELTETRQRLESLRAQIGQQEVNSVQSMTYDNPFQSKLADLELQLSTLSATFSPEHFQVRTLHQQIDTLKRAMESDVQTRAARQTTFVKNPIRESLLQDLVHLSINRSALETRRASQEQLIERLSVDLAKLPSLEQQYVAMQRETTLLEETLKMLKTEYEQAKIQRDSEEVDLRVFELAQTPTARVSKVKLRTILIGILIGLLLGVGLAFLLEYLDQTVKSPADIEKLLEVPLLGFVPLIEADSRLVEETRDLAKSVIEPFRAVRANLKHLIAQHGLQTLVVASAVKGEGKTTLAANLGITFALDGRRVVLVDCDLRRPQMHKLFNLPRENGVSEFLQGDAELEAILKATPYENLLVVTAGRQPVNPAELVGTERFGLMVAELRRRADLVLLDTPALLPVSDVITMAPHADAAIMVVRTLWTPAKAARQAATQLKRIGTNIIGGIMNGVSHGRGYYPYYYGYYGYYSYRYDDERAGARHGGGLRTWGLGIEEAAREYLQNLRYRLPRLAAEASRLARGFARRPLFWLLLALLVGLTVVERRLRPNRDDGPAGIRLLQADTPGVAMEAPGGIEIVRPLAAKQHTAPDATDEQGAESARALSDSMDLWAAALHRGDTLTALRFYDLGRVSVRLQDAVPGGEERLRHWLSSVATDSILVESAWLSTYAPPICTSEVVLATDRHGDTTRTAALLAWERNSGRWRIVAQRCSSPRRESNAR